MAARAIWKGTIVIGKVKLPVKLYSAAQDKSIHFRLLHKTDHFPVKQRMIDPDTGKPVEFKDARKALPITRSRLVIIDAEELAKIEPQESRDIEITRFVNPADIDHRFYERPYYLGPDGDSGGYFAAAQALRNKNKEGIARWVMRKRDYVGALREENGYLMLIALRHADEVIDADALRPPAGRPLQKREVDMARQLLKALEGTFDPAKFRDEYRARVMDLIEMKAKGRKPKVQKFRPRKTDEDRIANALEASLEKVSA